MFQGGVGVGGVPYYGGTRCIKEVNRIRGGDYMKVGGGGGGGG